MANPEMTLTFEWDGKTVHKETKGFKGKACVEKTAFVEKALGGHDMKRKLKPSYNEDSKHKKKKLTSGLGL